MFFYMQCNIQNTEMGKKKIIDITAARKQKKKEREREKDFHKISILL